MRNDLNSCTRLILLPTPLRQNQKVCAQPARGSQPSLGNITSRVCSFKTASRQRRKSLRVVENPKDLVLLESAPHVHKLTASMAQVC